VAFGVLLLRAQEYQASQSDAESMHSQSSAIPLILQENDGEHRVRRPAGATPEAGTSSIPEFILKIDKQNGNADDFLVVTEILGPAAIIPFHKHHNAEEVVIMEEGGASVTVGDKQAVAGPHSVVFIPRDTWVSIGNTGKNPIHFYALFSRQGFENYLRARSVRPGAPLAPLTPEELRRAADQGHAMYWDTSKGPYPPSEPTHSSTAPFPLILQEADGEHRVRRGLAPIAAPAQSIEVKKGPPFTIKVDGQNGNAQDFLVMTEIESPGMTIPFHMHHNSEEILILEEGGAAVTVGNKRAVAGPRSIVFIPRETWVSVEFTGTQPVHLYGLFSRQGFEQGLRAASVLEGQPVTPISADELPRLRATGHATYWDTSKGPYPPGVRHP